MNTSSEDEAKTKPIMKTVYYPTLRVYKTCYGSGNVKNETITHGKVVFNNGKAWNNTEGAVNDTSSWQYFYIGVRPKKSFIEVYTKVTDRDMNEVNEYVYDANLSTEQKLNVNGEFVVNSEATPYMLHDGESVYIKGLGINPISDKTLKRFENTGEVADTDDTSNYGYIKKVWVYAPYKDDDSLNYNDEGKLAGIKYNSHRCSIINADPANPDAVNGEYTKFTVHGKAGKFYIEYDTGYDDLDGNDVYEKFYFQIYDQTSWRGDFYDHADIEIADNGIYKMTREAFEYDEKGILKRDEDGNPVKYKYVTTYEAFVSNVNRSEIIDKYGNPLTLKDQYYGKYDTLIVGDNGVEGAQSTKYDRPRQLEYIPASDYWKDPSKKPGDTQFEMTSKYERNVVIENGKVVKNDLIYPSISDNLRIPMKDVDTVKFYVDLLLRPQTIQKYNLTDDVETAEPFETLIISEQPEQTIHNVVFDMDHQSVLDAYNKCPDHSGLDFTVKAELNDVITANLYYTELDFEAEKVFGHNELSSDVSTFDFELWYIPRDDYDYNPKNFDTYDYFKNEDGSYVLDSNGDQIKKAKEHILDTVKNGEIKDNIATIKFNDIPFFESVVSYTENTAKVHTYHYQIREKIPKNTDNSYKPNVAYDESAIDVYVELTKDINDSNTLKTKVIYEWYDAVAKSRVRKIVTEDKVKDTNASGLAKLNLITNGEPITIYQKFVGLDEDKKEIWGEYENNPNPQLVNKYKVYELPSAGGSGVYIYIISGAGLMLSAAVMYRRKRKEE